MTRRNVTLFFAVLMVCSGVVSTSALDSDSVDTARVNITNSNRSGKANGLPLTGSSSNQLRTQSNLFAPTDTLPPPTPDTIFVRYFGTAKLALTVSSNGNFGNGGPGRVNMDYVNYGDCDTTAETYLYDGSTVIGWVDGADTVMNWTIFSDGGLSDTNVFRSWYGFQDTAKWHYRFRNCPNFEYYRSDRFVTADTTLALQKFWFAPKINNSLYEDLPFIIQGLKVWNISGTPRAGVTIGDVIDWDVPSDFGAINASGANLSPSYLWQRGVDYTDTSLQDCQDDSVRWAGMQFIGRYTKTATMTLNDANTYSAYTARNDSFVVPNGGFIAGELYQNFAAPGVSIENSAADVHMGMCFQHNFTINPTDTFVFYTVLATVRNGSLTDLQDRLAYGKAWFYSRSLPITPLDSCLASVCCCIDPMRGNVNNSAGQSPTVADLTYLVQFLFNAGAQPPCTFEANVNGSISAQGYQTITVADLIYDDLTD